MSRNYKFHNPVKEGLIARPEDYLYSSAIDFGGGKGLLDGIMVVFQEVGLPRDATDRRELSEANRAVSG